MQISLARYEDGPRCDCAQWWPRGGASAEGETGELRKYLSRHQLAGMLRDTFCKSEPKSRVRFVALSDQLKFYTDPDRCMLIAWPVSAAAHDRRKLAAQFSSPAPADPSSQDTVDRPCPTRDEDLNEARYQHATIVKLHYLFLAPVSHVALHQCEIARAKTRLGCALYRWSSDRLPYVLQTASNLPTGGVEREESDNS
ncbi:hypothetical protein BH11PSE11_BH11PSE11_35650 [soil metagenome]